MLKSLDYLESLEKWIKSSKRHLRRLPQDKSCLSYGPGDDGHWSQQTNNTALGAYAELAVNPETNFIRAGLSKDEMLDTALALLRFTVNGHISGDGTCSNGKKWGHSWISNLCVERMAHSIENLYDYLEDRDKEGLRRMFISESDWLLDQYQIVAGLCSNNKPESNMWNGSVLWRTSLMYPDAPRAEEYREKGTAFLLNACSMPDDAASEELYRGRPLKEWHVGANFFPTAACNHHGYMNVGYINITLSNLAMLHFSGKHYGWELPKALYLHAEEIWRLAKACVFPDGRLLRIGGDTRVRYCYCQDYSVMVWLLAMDLFGDREAEAYEKGWLETVKMEQATNPDGSFMGGRLHSLETISPLYYTRLEGDKAASLSMAACWRRRFGNLTENSGKNGVPMLQSWHDDYHGSFLERSDRRIAAWTWEAAEPPMGLCLPTNASDMAEWRFNMAGQIIGVGARSIIKSEQVTKKNFAGGFLTSGSAVYQLYAPAAEGEKNDFIAKNHIAFATLPDDATVIVLQYAESLDRFYFTTIKGFGLNMPNDIFNGGKRTLECEGTVPQILATPVRSREKMNCGKWLNIDGQMGVCSFNGPLTLFRPERPQIAINHPEYALFERSGGQGYAEEICAGECMDKDFPRVYEKGQTLFDTACAVRIGVDPQETAVWAENMPKADVSCDDMERIRYATVRGADGKAYTLAMNIGDRELEITVNGKKTLLPPDGAELFF